MKINTCPWGKKNLTSQNYHILSLPLNMQKSNPSHAFARDGKIYLHYGDVITLDICFDLYLQPFDDMGHMDRMNFFHFSPKPVNDKANLSYVIFSAYSCSGPVGLLSVLFVCLCVLHFLAIRDTKQFNLSHQ